MRKNPRNPKPQKKAGKKPTNSPETNENPSSGDEKTLENEAKEYEDQRDARIAQNNARMEAMGLRNIANSLMNLSQKGGDRKSKKRVVLENGKDDDEYDPVDEEEDDDDDGSDDSLGEDFEEEGMKKKKKKKKSNVGSSSNKVELHPRVLIPDSSLQLMGFCGEKICLQFPKASEEEVKGLMDCYPRGFNGFDCEKGERALRLIAQLKADIWKLRRLHTKYPEFLEEVVEGLPFPGGFNGFNLEESIEISGVIVTLEAAYLRLSKFFQSNVHEGAKEFQPFVRPEAFGFPFCQDFLPSYHSSFMPPMANFHSCRKPY